MIKLQLKLFRLNFHLLRTRSILHCACEPFECLPRLRYKTINSLELVSDLRTFPG